MGTFNAGTLNGDPVRFRTTVHGPVVGYATVARPPSVAISSKRSSYGKDVLDQLLFRRLSTGQVHDPSSFFNAAAMTPQTFNSFYIDSKHIAEYTSGRLPLRPANVDPGLPTKGTGQYEWRGFLAEDDHIHGVDPSGGTMVNWNNISAHGFGAADDNWGGNGSVARVDLLNRNLQRLKSGGQVEPGLGGLGDERGRHPGREGDRHRSAATTPARGAAAPSPAGGADAVPAGRLARTMAAAGWTGTSTARSTIRGRRSWTQPGRRSRMRS